MSVPAFVLSGSPKSLPVSPDLAEDEPIQVMLGEPLAIRVRAVGPG